MLITDGTNTVQKADSVEYINVHLQRPNEYINVVLPDRTILTISSTDITVWDSTESLIKQIIIPKDVLYAR